MVINSGGLVVEIIRTDDGGVAPRIASAQPALLDDGNVGDAMFGSQVIGSGETMPTCADDDDVVFGFRLGRSPLLLPSLVAAKRLPGDSEGGIFTHGMLGPDSKVEIGLSASDRKSVV